jgi:hypothetical protein
MRIRFCFLMPGVEKRLNNRQAPASENLMVTPRGAT